MIVIFRYSPPKNALVQRVVDRLSFPLKNFGYIFTISVHIMCNHIYNCRVTLVGYEHLVFHINLHFDLPSAISINYHVEI